MTIRASPEQAQELGGPKNKRQNELLVCLGWILNKEWKKVVNVYY
jgi:hypothetical protein